MVERGAEERGGGGVVAAGERDHPAVVLGGRLERGAPEPLREGRFLVRGGRGRVEAAHPGEHVGARREVLDVELRQPPARCAPRPAVDEAERTLEVAVARGGAGGVDPRAVGEVGPAGAVGERARGDRRLVALGEPRPPDERERAGVADRVPRRASPPASRRSAASSSSSAATASPATASAHAHAASASARSAAGASGAASRTSSARRAAVSTVRGAHTGPRAAAARRSHAAASATGSPARSRRAAAASNAASASAPRPRHASTSARSASSAPSPGRSAIASPRNPAASSSAPTPIAWRAARRRARRRRGRARRAADGARPRPRGAGRRRTRRPRRRARAATPGGAGQVGVGGLAQERVAVADPAARGDEDPGLDGGGRGARRVGDRQPVELVAVEAAPGRRDALGEQPGLRGQRRARGAHGAAQARRRLVLAARERAGRLHGEQRVALGGGDDLRDVARGQRRDRPRQPRHVAGLERRQLDRRAQDAAGAERLLDARRPRGAAGAGGG